MNCQDWEERLSLYSGGDLPPGEAAGVERHLSECPGCQVFASGLKAAQELLEESHREPLAPAHFAAVRARVLAELERRRHPWWRREWIYCLVAASILMMLIVTRISRPEVPPPAVAMAHPPAPPLAARGGRQATNNDGQPHGTRPQGKPGEPVLVRVITNDPDVLIYWIAESRGE